MSFESDIRAHQARRDERFRRMFIDATEEVHRSITEGSGLTGAPGQPVQTGALKGSWVPSFQSKWVWRDVTNLEYAPVIETGVGSHGQITQRSSVGGFHSVAKTRTGWHRIVDVVTRRHAR